MPKVTELVLINHHRDNCYIFTHTVKLVWWNGNKLNLELSLLLAYYFVMPRLYSRVWNKEFNTL